MEDHEKTREQLLEELSLLRQRVATLETVDEELRNNRAILRATIDNLPFDFFAIGMNGHYMLQNATSRAHWGDAVGKRPEDVAGNEENLVLWRENNRRAFAGEKVEEEAALTIKGEKRCYHNVITPIIDAGQIQGILGMNVDITERKRAEEALLWERNRAQQYLDVAAVIMVVLDRDGKITLLNRKGHEILQYPDGALLGRHWFNTCVPASVREPVFAVFRQLMAGRLEPAEYYENPVATRSGEERIIAWHNTLLTDDEGKIVGTLSSGTDITERKRSEEALRESEERYRRLTESTTDMIYIADRNGNILYANSSAAAALGLDSSRVVGKRQEELFSPELARRHTESIAQVFETGEVFVTDSMYHFRSDDIWLNTRLIPLRDKDGQITSVMGVSRNITARKRAEEALKQAHNELEQRVQERTAELTKANEELAVFRRFVEASRQGFAMATLDGKITYVNPAISRLLADGRSEKIIGQHASTVYPPEYMQRREKEIIPSLLRDGHWQGEVAISHPKGSLIALQNSFLVRDEQGNPAFLSTVLTDITERKRAEEALRASENRYRTVVEDQMEVISRFGSDGKFIFVNDVFCRLFGKTKEQLLGKVWQPLAVSEDLPVIEEQLRSLSPSNPVVTVENRVYTASGQVRWMQFANRGFFDREGRLVETQAVGRDITERKRAEEAVRQSERRFRNYFDQGLIGMAATAPDKRWLQVNDRICDILGYAREELLKKTWSELTHPEDLAKDVEQFNLLLQGEIEHYTLDKRFLRKDGSVAFTTISIRVFRTEGGAIDHVVCLMEDITARKQAEMALRQSEETYRALVEASPDAVLMTDLEGNIVFASQQSTELFGYDSAEELCEQKATALVVEEERQRLTANISLLVQQSVRRQIEYIGVRRDGTRFSGEVSSAVLRDDRGAPKAFMAMARDITARKQAEEALRQQHRTLKHLLQSSDHERQVIAYEIHDELAQQLAGAIMQLQTYSYQKETNAKLAAKAFDAGMTMLQQGHAEARRLISGVRPPILDEEGVVEAIAHLVHEQNRLKGPKIECSSRVAFNRLVPTLENSIYRIAQEALANACCHSKSENVKVSLWQRENRIRIEVRDWGIGFDAKAVHENRYGLEGIRQRARLLGGKCSIRSKAGQGTRISVELPMVERE